MIQFDKTTLHRQPYPYLTSDEMLTPALFAELQREFPATDIFAANRKQAFADGRASRINLGRGDPLFREFMSASPAWRAFFAHVNSPVFIAQIIDLFAGEFATFGSTLDLRSWRFSDHVTTPPPTLASRVFNRLRLTQKIDRVRAALDPNKFCIDFDIAWAQNGYATEPHTDNRNKLAAMLVYFGETGGSGGDFQVMQLATPKPLAECGRYPSAGELAVLEVLSPRPNRGAVFLNCNNSYHVVTPLANSDRPRQFLYVSVSSRYTAPIW